MMYEWARYPLPSEEGYEVSSAGDRRFSALYATVRGHTIEWWYQVKVKGYSSITAGKGLEPRYADTDTWGEYLKLWKEWALDNKELVAELRVLAEGKVLTDKFASTNVSQARALSIILNDG